MDLDTESDDDLGCARGCMVCLGLTAALIAAGAVIGALYDAAVALLGG